MKQILIFLCMVMVTSCAVRIPADAQVMTLKGTIVHTYLNKKGTVLAFDIYDTQQKKVFKVCNVYEFNNSFIQNKTYSVEVYRILTDKRPEKRKLRHAKGKRNRWEESPRYSKYQYNFKKIW